MYVLFAIVGYIGTPVHLFLIPYFAMIGATWLSLLNVVSFATWTTSVVANRSGRHHLAIMLVTIEVFVHSVVSPLTLGLSLGFQHYLWGGLTFIMLNNRLGKVSITVITTGLGTAFGLLSLCAGSIEYSYRYEATVPYVRAINVAIAFVASALAAYHFRTSTQHAEHELEQLANFDALTGLYNRRQLTAELDKRLDGPDRDTIALSVALIDVDHFKTVNDTLGHEAGDIVLRDVAHRLASCLRPDDLIGRWGGEEFLVALDGSEHDAQTIAERLRQVIADTPCPTLPHPTNVTVTLGLARHEPCDSLEATIHQADLALYAGKRGGRNRVAVAPHECRTGATSSAAVGRPTAHTPPVTQARRPRTSMATLAPAR